MHSVQTGNQIRYNHMHSCKRPSSPELKLNHKQKRVIEGDDSSVYVGQNLRHAERLWGAFCGVLRLLATGNISIFHKLDLHVHNPKIASFAVFSKWKLRKHIKLMMHNINSEHPVISRQLNYARDKQGPKGWRSFECFLLSNRCFPRLRSSEFDLGWIAFRQICKYSKFFF